MSLTGFGKDGKGQVIYRTSSTGFALGALGAGSGVLSSIFQPTEDFRVLKAEVFVSIDTLDEDDPALVVGFCDGELTLAEVEECLESTVVDANDNVELEESHRPVWPVGIPSPGALDTRRTLHATWTPRWTFGDDEGFDMWVYNLGPNAIAAGAQVVYMIKFWGVWVR